MHIVLHHARRTCVAIVTAVIAASLLWWGLWTLSAVQYRHFIDHWIEGRRAVGYQITYDNRDTEGFPRQLSLHFRNFIMQSADGVKIHANDVSISTFPWQWHNLDAKLKHGFDLTIPFAGEKTLVIGTDTLARNHTELEENGDWHSVDLQLTKAKALWGSNPFFSAGIFEIALARPIFPPKDHTQPGLTLSFSGNEVTLPTGMSGPFGPQVTKIDIDMRVMGPMPDPRDKAAVDAWNNASGVMEFDNFHMQWGPLAVTARGTLGLDDDLQPEGAFSGQIGNHEEVLKVLMAQNYIPKREAGMLNSALGLFSRQSNVGGKSGIEIPITVQLGGFFLGPVRVFEFPQIKWENVRYLPGMSTDTPAPAAPANPVAPADAAPAPDTASPTVEPAAPAAETPPAASSPAP